MKWVARGEWVVQHDGKDENAMTANEYQSGHYIAHVVEPSDLTNARGICDANAHLIAAAPDLLDACTHLDSVAILIKDIGNGEPGWFIDDTTRQIVNAAIAKAREE